MKINYIDTSGKSKSRTNFAFLIENEKQMADRLNTIPIKTVRDRYYLGFCRSEHELKPVLNVFKEKKQEIYNLYLQSEFLDKKGIIQTTIYLDEFYRLIEKENTAILYFSRNCRHR